MRRLPLLLTLAPLLGACEDGSVPDINLFSIQDDMDLGAELDAEIESHPKEYGEVLDPDEYAEAYDHLYRIRDEILASGEVEHADEFEWETHILHDDEVLNAFAAPGGYIYVYTGLLRYLDQEDHFAGVLGHEIAHAANRHATEQMSKQYGIDVLISFLLGKNPGIGAELAAGLVGLEFSREDEEEADAYSVYYLCETLYASDGTAGFFEKLVEEGSLEVPEFLSTHPSSDSRVEDIRALAEDLGCSTDPNPDAEWAAFLDSLP